MSNFNEVKELLGRIEKLEAKVDFLENQFETIKKISTSERLQTYLNKVDKVQKMSNLFVSLDESDNELEEKLLGENKNVIDNMLKQNDIAGIPMTYEGVKEYSSNLDSELEGIESGFDEQLSKDNWDDIFEYEIKNGEVIIKKYIAFDAEEISVPEKINGFPVVEIGDKAFENCKATKYIDLPDSIVKIGEGAFSNCGLIDIKLPKQLKIIERMAFYRCLFTEIIIPDFVSEIGSYSFYSCANLYKISLPKNLKKISEGAFSNCIALECIDIPEVTNTIESKVFEICEKLQHIRIPNSVINLGYTSKNSNSGWEEIFKRYSKKIGELTIYCKNGSEALKYARNHNFKIDKYENYSQINK